MVHRGGHTVGKGTYWGIRNGQRVDITQEGMLPGDSKTIYLKAPALAVILLAPVLGLVYAVFLPFIGIAMALMVAARKVGESASGLAAKSVSFGWRPVEAYLAGRRKKKAERKAGKQTPKAKQ